MVLKSKTDYNGRYNHGGCILPRKSFFALWSQYRAYFVITISLFICVVSFQNCTPQLDLEEDGSGENASLSDTTPFAFDISIDHFALMTCNTAGLSHKFQDGKFTYKWGAYQNGMATPGRAGLKFSDQFMSRYGGNVPAKIFTVLDDSEKNKNLEIASGLYVARGYKGRKGFDTPEYRSEHSRLQVNSFFMDLSLNKNKTLAHFPDMPISSVLNRTIEGVMFRRTLANENVMTGSYIDEFTATINFDRLNTYPVGIGFGHASVLAKDEAKSLISENGGYSNESAVGRSYLPQFTGVRSSHVRYLSGIRESSMDGKNLSASWGCPTDLRLKIVQRKDIEANRISTCRPSLISASDLARQDRRGKALRSIANILDLTVWEVGLDLNDSRNNCIVKRSQNDADSCYDAKYNPYLNDAGRFEQKPVVRVDYSNTQSICGSSNPIRNEPRVAGGKVFETFYMCPHYVSICVKYN